MGVCVYMCVCVCVCCDIFCIYYIWNCDESYIILVVLLTTKVRLQTWPSEEKPRAITSTGKRQNLALQNLGWNLCSVPWVSPLITLNLIFQTSDIKINNMVLLRMAGHSNAIMEIYILYKILKCSTNVILKHLKNKIWDNYLAEQGLRELIK